MATHTNQEVINAFLNQRPAKAGRLTTDGHSLYSYALVIGKWFGGKPFVFDYTTTGGAFKSMTTSQHVGLIKRALPKDNVMLVEFAKSINIIGGE
jgi:hypothetical protein